MGLVTSNYLITYLMCANIKQNLGQNWLLEARVEERKERDRNDDT